MLREKVRRTVEAAGLPDAQSERIARIRVRHLRRPLGVEPTVHPADEKPRIVWWELFTNRTLRENGHRPDPHGGKTEVQLLDADGNVIAEGEAMCRPDEHFCRSLGWQIAVGRALASLR